MSGDPGDDPGLPRGVVIERQAPRLTGRLVFGQDFTHRRILFPSRKG